MSCRYSSIWTNTSWNSKVQFANWDKSVNRLWLHSPWVITSHHRYSQPITPWPREETMVWAESAWPFLIARSVWQEAVTMLINCQSRLGKAMSIYCWIDYTVQMSTNQLSSYDRSMDAEIVISASGVGGALREERRGGISCPMWVESIF